MLGAPFGPNSGVAEDVGTPDLIATTLEAVIVLGSAVLLWRLRGGRGFRVVSGSRWLVSGAAVVCIIVAAVSTAEKAALALEHGADDTVIYPAAPFDAVRRFSS